MKQQKTINLALFLFLFVSFMTFVSKAKAADSWQTVGDLSAVTYGEDGFYYSDVHINSQDGKPYVAYFEYNTYKLGVLKYNGSSWVQVGNEMEVDPLHFSYAFLRFNPYTDEAYAVVDDFDDDSNEMTTVMKFNGSSWETVGDQYFTSRRGFDPDITFSPITHDPYIALIDSNGGYIAKIMKYDGDAWVSIGDPIAVGPSNNEQFSVSLAIDSQSDVPYVAYNNVGGARAGIVKKFSSGSWQTVGGGEFSSGSSTTYITLRFNSARELYLSYAGSSIIKVKKLDGASWSDLNAPDTEFPTASTMAINPENGKPYLSYTENSLASVVYYSSGTWSEPELISPEESEGMDVWDFNPFISFNSESGVPYVIFDHRTYDGETSIDALTVRRLGNDTAATSGNNDNDDDDHDHHGKLYKEYRELRLKYRNEGSKKIYQEIKALQKSSPAEFEKMKIIYQLYKKYSNDELKNLDKKTLELFKKYKKYRGYKQYLVYKRMFD